MSGSRTEKHLMNFLSFVFIFLVILSTDAQAEMYAPWWEWSVVENELSDPDLGQLSVNVTPGPGSNQVKFTFFNNISDEPSSITVIYFDDGALLGISSVDNSDPGVNFISPASSPSELKGANNVDPDFETSAGFSAQSTKPPYHDGVNFGESVGIVFDLKMKSATEYYDFDDVIAAINLGFTDPADYTGGGSWYDESLRIGINVQGLLPDDTGDGDGDYSESYILTPIPPSMILGILGMGVVGLKLRKYA